MIPIKVTGNVPNFPSNHHLVALTQQFYSLFTNNQTSPRPLQSIELKQQTVHPNKLKIATNHVLLIACSETN